MENFARAQANALILEMIRSGKLELPRPDSSGDHYDPEDLARQMANIHAEYFRTLLGNLMRVDRK